MFVLSLPYTLRNSFYPPILPLLGSNFYKGIKETIYITSGQDSDSRQNINGSKGGKHYMNYALSDYININISSNTGFSQGTYTVRLYQCLVALSTDNVSLLSFNTTLQNSQDCQIP